MPTLQQTGGEEIVCVPTEGRDVEELLSEEWLLTNERGSYSSSTIVGCNTSGYHGLLIGSPEPLVNRIMALSGCLEIVLRGEEAFELSTFEFPDRFVPTGYSYLREFRRDIGVRFLFSLEPVDLSKAVYLARDSDTVVVEYTFEEVRAPVDFVLRPFIGLRDFHTLQRAHAPLTCDFAKGVGTTNVKPGVGDPVLLARNGTPNGCELSLGCSGMRFERDPQWWFNFTYRVNRERGQHYTEDLWAPGFFKAHIEPASEPRLHGHAAPGHGHACASASMAPRIVFWARLSDYGKSSELPPVDAEAIKRDLLLHRRQLIRQAEAHWVGPSLPMERNNLPSPGSRSLCRCAPRDDIFDPSEGEVFRVLCLAADQFVARRQGAGGPRTTIVAGFPWFADWGRDTFIALPGLLLTTGRYDEAGSVLRTFAAAVDEGMVPNHFDDRTGVAYFNSVDASLWFIHAAFEYLDATGNREGFARELLPAIQSIIDLYHRGTRFGIHADADGLIMAGDRDTQLTWMDAKCDGIAVTPRYGKAVEVNALWHNALRRMERLHAEIRNSKFEIRNSQYGAMAEQVGRSFCRLFWNERLGYLNDTILQDGSIDARLRPNQIFAISLPYGPPLTREQQQAVVSVVARELLTPYGLRTLGRRDASYLGRFEGSLRCRDEAYHQGTVWPYLIGPFVEACLRVDGFSPQSKREAAELIRPLLRHLVEDGCLGSISEVFDGDPPHRPAGCHAQAWSVAELIRVYRMVTEPVPPPPPPPSC